jgi:hypothetical protein
MRELCMQEIEAVSGGDGSDIAQGGAAVLALAATAPIGFAMGFGLAVGVGLLYLAYSLE